MRAVMLRTEGLAKSFTLHLQGGVRIPVLSDLALEVRTGECVALALQDEQPHQRLHAGYVDAARFELVFVVEGYIAQRCRAGGRGCHGLTPKIVFLDRAGTG